MSRSLRDPPGTFNPKVNQKTVPDASTGFEVRKYFVATLEQSKKKPVSLVWSA